MRYSFIIPIFNCRQHIVSCIQKIQRADIPDYEIVIVDDGSTDGSGDLCRKIAEETAGIRYLFQENKGVSSARNTGIKAAEGDYIFFVDADDSINSTELSKVIQGVETSSPSIPSVSVFGSCFDYYYKDRLYCVEEKPVPIQGCMESSQWLVRFKTLFQANIWSPVWNKIYRRDFLIKNRILFREDMFLFEDLEFTLQCLAKCERILFLPQMVYRYRLNEGGGSRSRIMRLKSVSLLIDQIEMAMDDLITDKDAQYSHIKETLNIIYLSLLREKIKTSGWQETEHLCQEYKRWYNGHCHYAEKQNRFMLNVLNARVWELKRKAVLSSLRHFAAVNVKSSSVYRYLNR